MNLSLRRVFMRTFAFFSFQFSPDAIEASNVLGASLADYHLYLAMRFPLVLYKLNFIAVFVFFSFIPCDYGDSCFLFVASFFSLLQT